MMWPLFRFNSVQFFVKDFVDKLFCHSNPALKKKKIKKTYFRGRGRDKIYFINKCYC